MDELPDPVADTAPDRASKANETARVPGTGLHDIVAVSHDGSVYCLGCANPEYVDLCRGDAREIPHGGPIRRADEFDCPGPSCDNCLRRIESVNVLHYDAVCGEHCPAE